LDVLAWAGASGVGPDHIIDLGVMPNARMPALLREMDVALFPNRAEGGTNMVAMEAMGCGAPCILSANTGHLDLIEGDNCYPLEQQGVLSGAEGPFGDVAGWGESDIDEIVETLERAYLHRQEARERGLRGAAAQAERTWARTAAGMKEIILSL
jgi:glycosyltransferase involved in cell wall biosynthesis